MQCNSDLNQITMLLLYYNTTVINNYKANVNFLIFNMTNINIEKF